MAKIESKQITPTETHQIVNEFQPTPAMRVWLDTAIEIASDSPTEIASASKVSRQNWYDWMQLANFEDWYYEEYKKRRRRWIPSLDNIGLKHAKKGDYQFWRDMNRKAGESMDDRGESKVQVNVLNTIQNKRAEYDI